MTVGGFHSDGDVAKSAAAMSPPIFCEIFRNARFAQGGDAHFEGRVAANPTAKIVWTRNGSQMMNSQKHRLYYDEMSGKVSLKIFSIGSGDEGEYTCSAINPYGEAICTVYISPEITKQIRKSKCERVEKHSQQVRQQHQLGMEMDISGNMEEEMKRVANQQRDMVDNSNNYSSAMMSSGQQSQHANNFQQQSFQKVQQEQHSVSSSQQISNSSFSSSHRQQASSSSFQSSFSSKGLMSSEEKKMIPVQHHQVVHQQQAQQSMSKSMQSQQMRSEGENTSNQMNMALSKQFPSPKIVKPAENLKVFEGETAVFEANVTPVDDPDLRIHWCRSEGKSLITSSRIKTCYQYGIARLQIQECSKEDSGTDYICIVTNKSGEAKACSSLNVMSKMTQSSSPAMSMMSQSQMESTRRENSYSALSMASMSTTSRQEQQQAMTQVDGRFSSQCRTMSPMTCKPEFLKSLPDDLKINEGQTFHIECQITPTTDSHLKVEWFKDGQPLIAGSRITTTYNFGIVGLNIADLRLEDAGQYICHLSNDLGEAMSGTNLHVEMRREKNMNPQIAHAQQQKQSYFNKFQSMESNQQTTLESIGSNEAPIQPPEFKTELKDALNIKESGFAHFEARVEPMGDQTMTVEWFKDGQACDASSRITTFFNFGYVALTVKNVLKSDEGTYTCEVKNASGRTSQSARLTIVTSNEVNFGNEATMTAIQQLEERRNMTLTSNHEQSFNSGLTQQNIPPTFLTEIKGTNLVTEGHQIHMECRIEPQGDPSMNILWLHNGSDIKASSRIKAYYDFGYVALDILDANQEDEGQYVVVARNNFGSTQLQFNVKVDTAGHLVDTTTMHDQTYREIQRLESHSQMQKTQMHIQKQETAEEVTPPNFVRQLTARAVKLSEGRNLHIEAQVEPNNDENMKVEWQLNGQPLTIGSRIRTVSDFGFVSLDINGITCRDQGTYTCKARNKYGEDQSTIAISVSDVSEDAMLTESSIVDSVKFDSSFQRSQFVSTQQNMVEERHETDSYEPQVPEFTKRLREKTEISESQNLHLEVRLQGSGDQTMRVTWLHNGQPVKIGHRYKQAFDFDYIALDVSSVFADDNGVYTCVAQNKLGSVQTSTNVTVKESKLNKEGDERQQDAFIQLEEKMHQNQTLRRDISEQGESSLPSFQKSLSNVSKNEGENAHFQCQYSPSNDPNLRIFWFHNGHSIKQGSRFREAFSFGRATLDIQQVDVSDVGNYQCRAVNMHGECVSNSAVLNVQVSSDIQQETIHQTALTEIQNLEHAKTKVRGQQEGEPREKPKFLTNLRDVLNLDEGKSAHFEAKLVPIGDPTLKVEWLKDNKPIPASNRLATLYDFGYVALDLRYTRTSDSGSYTCRAYNKMGEVRTTAKLQVSSGADGPSNESLHKDALDKLATLEAPKTTPKTGTHNDEESAATPPKFVMKLQGKSNLMEGQTAHMECRIEPYPDPTLNLTWYFNEKPLPFGNRWRTSCDFGYSSLDVLSAYPEDSGKYTVRATNALGSVESSVNIRITSQNDLMNMDHERALQKIHNLENKRKMPLDEQISLIEAPIFGHGLKSLEIEEGHAAHFETTLTPVNDGSMSVEWLLNDKPINMGHRFKVLHDFGFVALDILYAYPEDSGVYKCKAKNKTGQIETSCKLRVKENANLLLDTMDKERLHKIRGLEKRERASHAETPIQTCRPVFTTSLKDAQGIAEQSHVHLECRLEPINDPTLDVDWFMNGKPLQVGHRFRTTHDFGFVALDILYAYPQDSGNYICKATNVMGEAVNGCTVEVLGRESLLLDSNHPESWKKVKSLEDQHSTRTIESAEVSLEKPFFNKELTGLVHHVEGQTAQFEAQIGPLHDPNLTVEYFHNEKPIKQGYRIQTLNDFGYVALKIAELVQSDAGEYSCVVSNKLGSMESKIMLEVQPKSNLDMTSQHPKGLDKIQELEAMKSGVQEERQPSFQKPVFTQPMQSVRSDESTNVKLTASLIPVGDPSMKVQWLKDGQSLQSGTRLNYKWDFGCISLNIDNLRKEDEGIYECKAVNSMGEAVMSASIIVRQKETIVLDSQTPSGMKKVDVVSDNLISNEMSSDVKFEKPMFIESLKSATTHVRDGEKAHLQCRVVPASDPNLQCEWTLNDNPVEMSSRVQMKQEFGLVSLDITPFRSSDVGMYTLKATNVIGVATSSFALYLTDSESELRDKMMPRFVDQLNVINEPHEGQEISLHAKIEPANDENITVDWKLNGETLSMGSRIMTSLEFGQLQLRIKDLRTSDSGLYTCTIRNKFGHASSTTNINIPGGSEVDSLGHGEKSAPIFESPISSLNVTECQSGHMETRLRPINDPTMKVEWFHNNKALKLGHRFRTFYEFGIVILEILDTCVEDSGTYECRATNSHGTAKISTELRCKKSSSIIATAQVSGNLETTLEKITNLDKHGSVRGGINQELVKTAVDGKTKPPRFTLPLTEINNLKEGENAHFEARITPVDDPSLQMIWLRNGKVLKASSRIRTFNDFGFIILEISPVYPEDSGKYECRAKNDVGEAVTAASLTCKGKRNIIMDSQLPENMRGAIDKIANLEKTVVFYDKNVPEDQISEENPTFTKELEDITVDEHGSIHLQTQVTPTKDGSMTIQWFHNQNPIAFGSRLKAEFNFGFATLDIGKVVREDGGVYTCKAKNAIGQTTTKCVLNVKTYKGVIDETQLPNSYKTELLQKLDSNLSMSSWKRQEILLDDPGINKPPKFVTDIRDVAVWEGQAAHFDCRVEPIGDGSMAIEWFRDGQPLTLGSRLHTIYDFGFVVLDFDWTFQRDSGVYVCRATNKFGSAETSAKITCKSQNDISFDSQLPPGMSLERLKELEQRCHELDSQTGDTADEDNRRPPKFLTTLTSKSVGEGEPVHFSCRVEPKTDSKLEIKWYHKNEELKSGHRFRMTHEFGYVALDILYSYPEDEGEFVCKAVNELGEDVTKCELLCKELPAIQMENQLQKGMNKSDYVAQMEATMKKYTQSLVLTENDIYEMEKQQPPRFVTQIQSITNLVEMQSTKFECQLAPVGDPNMKIEWFFNGKPLASKNRFTPIYDFGYVAMNFGWVYPEDSGEYVCRATNLCGYDETRGIIRTTGKPGIIYDSQLPKGMSSIQRIHEMESGWQRSPNDDGDDEEIEKSKPCFVTKPEPQTVHEGECTRFVCRVTGYPKARVMWLINGKTVINGSKHKLLYDGMWHFDIPKTRPVDGGKIEVIARNQCGEAYAATTLTVKKRKDNYRDVLKNSVKRDYLNSKGYRKPEWITRMEEIQKRLSEQKHSAKFVQEIREVRIARGLTAMFEATFAGNPSPNITWFFNGQLMETSENDLRIEFLVKDNKSSLTLKECTESDNGVYMCVAENDLGSDSTRATLTVSEQKELKAEIIEVLPDDQTDSKKSETIQKSSKTQKTKKRETSNKDQTSRKVPEDSSKQAKTKGQATSAPSKTSEAHVETKETPTPKEVAQVNSSAVETKDDHRSEEEEMAVNVVNRLLSNETDLESQLKELRADYEKHDFQILETWHSQYALLQAAQRLESAPNVFSCVETFVTNVLQKTEKLNDDSEANRMANNIGFHLFTSLVASKSSDQSDFVLSCLKSDDFKCFDSNREEKTKADIIDIVNKLVESKMSTVEVLENNAEVVARETTIDVTISDDDMKEGDLFFALATFISESGEAMNLVEGEKVFLLEWKDNKDWWYVQKQLTDECGWVPAQYLRDEVNYTSYVKQKLREKIEKLPVFNVSKEDENVEGEAPRVIEPLQPCVATDGQPVELTCKMSGVPRPNITWFRQTAIIKPSQDFEIYYDENSSSASLLIKEVFPEDGGSFTCVGKNCFGFANTSTDLVVHRRSSKTGQEANSSTLEVLNTLDAERRSLSRESSLADIVEGIPPTFSQRQQTKCVTAGQSVELECRYIAIPEADIRWLKDKQEISGDDVNSRFTITNIADMHMYCSILKIDKVSKSEDGGLYEVHAKNSEGQSVYSLILQVMETTGEEQKTVETSKIETVEELLPSSDHLEVTRQLTDVEVEEGKCVSLSLEVASNDFILPTTTTKSSQVTSNVKWKKDGLDLDLKSLDCIMSVESLKAPSPDDVPDESLSISAKQEDDEFDGSWKERKKQRISLTINKATVHHEGEYVVEIEKDKDGSRKISSCEVTVVELPPKVMKPMENLSVNVGEKIARFSLHLSRGDVITKWLKDGQDLTTTTSNRHKILVDGKVHVLEIREVEQSDEGTFTCYVNDEVKSSACLKISPVLKKLEFIESLTSKMEGKVASDLKLSVKLSDKCENIKWFKGGKEITFGKEYSTKYEVQREKYTYTLVIMSVNVEDSDTYKCVIDDTLESSTDVEIISESSQSISSLIMDEMKLQIDVSKMRKSDIIVIRGDEAIFEIPFKTSIEDYQKLDAVWSFKKREVFARQNVSFNVTKDKCEMRIKNCDTSESGSYAAQLKIRGQTLDATFNLVVKDKPSVPRGPVKLTKVVNNSSSKMEMKVDHKSRTSTTSSYKIQWNPSELDGGLEIEKYVIERKEESSSKSTRKSSWKVCGSCTEPVSSDNSLSTVMKPFKSAVNGVVYSLRIMAINAAGSSDPLYVDEKIEIDTNEVTVMEESMEIGSSSQITLNVHVMDVTSRSVTVGWKCLFSTIGDVGAYIIHRRRLTSSSSDDSNEKWEKVATVGLNSENNVKITNQIENDDEFKFENLQVNGSYKFGVGVENCKGESVEHIFAETDVVHLKSHAADVPSPPSAPLEIRSVGPHSVIVEWGIPEYDGGAPLESYKIAVRDASRQMWMEVGTVSADTQKLRIQELVEGHAYHFRIYAKNEVGFSLPLERSSSDESFMLVRPSDYTEEDESISFKVLDNEDDDTPSLSFTTETSSWLRDANMDPSIRSYTTSSILRRNEYFFRIWFYASKIFS